MYKNNFFSKFQGAWQKDKITTQNVSTLIQIYENANLFNKEIHATYINLMKAYDSVEHWSIREILENYGMGNTMVDLIMSLLQDTKLTIITDYG